MHFGYIWLEDRCKIVSRGTGYSREVVVAVILWMALPLSAADLADAARGAKVLADQQCLNCHDLTTRPKVAYTIPGLVGKLWNHASAAWQTGRAMTTQDGEDMLAWFAAQGYFEESGTAMKGAKIFYLKRCATCHESKNGNGAPAVSRWPTLANPINLYATIWRHAPLMKASMDRKTEAWPSLSMDEVRDVLAHAERTGAERKMGLRIGDVEKGRRVMAQAACVTCHPKESPVQAYGPGHSLTELGAILWNHAPMMTSLPPSLSEEEIADVLGFLWKERYFERVGNAARGKEEFEEKGCSGCHSPAPSNLHTQSATMIQSLWKHTPAVLKTAKWLPFRKEELADVTAFLRGK